MFIKVTTSGPRRYVQLVESYRDDAGRVKKRTVATLGRLDRFCCNKHVRQSKPCWMSAKV